MLVHLGLASSRERVPVTVILDDGTAREVELAPAPEDVQRVETAAVAATPLHRQRPGEKRWYHLLPESRALYVQIDELEASPEELTSDWLAGALAEGRKAGAERLILDLRADFGGSGSWNEAIVRSTSRARRRSLSE